MKRRSFTRTAILSLLSVIIITVVCERVASMLLERRLHELVDSEEFIFSSSNISLFRQAIRIYDLEWQPQTSADSSSNKFKIEKVTARGVGILSLLRGRSVNIKRLVVENGSLVIGNLSPASDSTTAQKLFSLRQLQVGTLQLTNTSLLFQTHGSAAWSGIVDLTVQQVHLKDPSTPWRIESYEGKPTAIKIRNLNLEPEGGFFSMKIANIEFDHEKDILNCDSIRVIPLHSKLEYAHVRGTQSTWVDIHVPHIEARGFDLNYHQDTTVTASHITVRDARIIAFRDRRVPLRRKSEVPLPMTWLRDLEIAIEVDSLEVTGMDVTYEHFSEEGFKPGKLHFTGLDATFHNVVNRRYNNTQPVTTLVASSKVMGGSIEGRFTFPLVAGARYEATGRIRNLPLSKLNPMLENAAFVSIESGQLNDLSFHFQYDNNVSTGELAINYEGLKVKGLKKDRAGNENQVKTLVANTALRNNNNKSGKIYNERDKRRFIFHYWATSLMAGMRDAVMPVANEKKKK